MESSRKIKIDIFPDVSIYRKLGQKGYKLDAALSELIDNSIDATVKGSVTTVKIHIGKDNGEGILVEDNAKGNTQEEVEDMIILGKSKKQDKLGEFGIGMKAACSSLGSKYSILTKSKDSEEEYLLTFDESKFEHNKTWADFEFEAIKPTKNWHGTSIYIEGLRDDLKVYYNKIERLKEQLSRRYSPFLEDKTLRIFVIYGSTLPEELKPVAPDYERKYKIEFDFDGSKIEGIFGIMKRSSQVGYYGFDLYKNNRLIKAYVKRPFIRAHPENAKLRGRLNLDSVPTTFSKDEFIDDIEGSELFNRLGKKFNAEINTLLKEYNRDKQKERKRNRIIRSKEILMAAEAEAKAEAKSIVSTYSRVPPNNPLKVRFFGIRQPKKISEAEETERSTSSNSGTELDKFLSVDSKAIDYYLSKKSKDIEAFVKYRNKLLAKSKYNFGDKK
jgi:hypothetical protein